MRMPRYQCHKQVWALPIREVRQSPADHVVDGGSWEIVPDDSRYGPISVTHDWYTKHQPVAGGYYVAYHDGYASFSPKDAFEAGYTGIGQAAASPSIEQEIQAKGLTAPRVTPADIEAEIAGEYSFTAATATEGSPQFPSLALLTFCVLVLKNGFTVTGESACASPENFDAEIGRKIARQNAVAKIWPLLGFRLRDRLHRQGPYNPRTDAMDGGRLG